MAEKKRGSGGIAAVCRELAQPLAESLGLSLWDVRFVKEGSDWFLRIVIDKEGGVTINDCVDLTHLINPVLDKEDPIPQAYCLEVMSPGVERELTRPEHFEAFLGEPVTARLIRPAENGLREFVGLLTEVTDDTLSLALESGEIRQFSRKELSAVRAVDLWDEDTQDDTITEE